MPTAELRPVDRAADRPTFEVWTEPWEAEPFSGPAGRNWDAFSARENGATYHWRGGPDILADMARDAAKGRITLAQVLADERVSRWLSRESDRYLDELEGEEEAESLSPEDVCQRLLDAMQDGSMEIDTYDGEHSYYYFEWTNYIEDAAHALELPEWAARESFDGGGPGSSYGGWYITLDAGKTLQDLEEWLYDPTRSRAVKP
jgi:hypothetical protein